MYTILIAIQNYHSRSIYVIMMNNGLTKFTFFRSAISTVFVLLNIPLGNFVNG